MLIFIVVLFVGRKIQKITKYPNMDDAVSDGSKYKILMYKSEYFIMFNKNSDDEICLLH